MPDIMGDEAAVLYQKIDPDLQIIGISGDDSDEAFRRNLKAGSYLFLNRSIKNDRLLEIVRSYCKKYDDHKSIMPPAEPTEAQNFIAAFGMVGSSQHLVEVCRLIEKYSSNDESVLISGANGTGKERVAKAIPHEDYCCDRRESLWNH